ncbi:MAG: acyl-CoA dehydrogenase family protein [Acidimicrobiia bacterium]
MDLTYPPEAEAFRTEIRSWLEQNLPRGWFDESFTMTPQEKADWADQWVQRLYDGGWICATWPTEYGGRGLTVMQGVVLAEEFARAGAPFRADFFGDTLVGPTILQWGTEEQKRHFLPLIQRGQIRWCQGFSEPDAGSDLASLKCSAVLDGDEWVINGQKVWTSQARHADYIFLLVRTDTSVALHAGISYLLVPMNQPGVEVRPIVQPDGTAEFAETFFTDARCSADAVVGGINNGWKVAMTTLGFERGVSATTSYRRFETEVHLLIAKARENGRINDPVIRQRVSKAYTSVQLMRIAGLRSLSATVQRRKDPSIAALSATNKMMWSEHHQRAMELALDIWGMDALLLTGRDVIATWPGTVRFELRDGYPVTPMHQSFFFSRSETIWGGTSQIQRNIVAERVLGLPKEPK